MAKKQSRDPALVMRRVSEGVVGIGGGGGVVGQMIIAYQ